MKLHLVIFYVVVSLAALIPRSAGFDIDRPDIADKIVTMDLDGDTLQFLSPYPRSFHLYTCAWHPSGDYCLMGGSDGVLLKYDGTVITDLTSISKTVSNIMSIDWNEDGTKALMAVSPIYGVETPCLLEYDGATILRIDVYSGLGGFVAVAWKPDYSYALVGGGFGRLYKYTSDGVLINVTDPEIDETIYNIAWKPDGSSALLGTSGGILEFNGTVLKRNYDLNGSYLWGVQYAPSGSFALVWDFLDRVFKFDGVTVNLIGTLPGITGVYFKDDGDMAYFVDAEGIKTYNGTTIDTIYTYPDGIGFFSGGDLSFDDVNGELMIVNYQIATFKDGIFRFRSHIAPAYSVSIRTDPISGKTVIFGHGIYLLEGSNLEMLDPNISPNEMCWNHDGTAAYGVLNDGRLVVVRDGGIEFVYSPTGECLRSISWNRMEDYGLIVGGIKRSLLYKFDGTNFTNLSALLSFNPYHMNVVWAGDGSYALINCGRYHWAYVDGGIRNLTEREIGEGYIFDSISFVPGTHVGTAVGAIYSQSDYTYNAVFTFDGWNFTHVGGLGGGGFAKMTIACHPSGIFSIISFYDKGVYKVFKYIGGSFKSLTYTGYGTISDIAWSANGDHALMIGKNTVVRYIPSNDPPLFLSDIADLKITEDDERSGKGAIDLSEHFADDDLEFARVQAQHENGDGIVDLRKSGRFVDIVQKYPNSFGKDKIKLLFMDKMGIEVVSNWFTVTVEPSNDPVTIEKIGDWVPNGSSLSYELTQGQTVTENITISDPDGDFTGLSLTPAGAGLYVERNVMTFYATNELSGVRKYDLTAGDRNSSADTVKIIFHVTNMNDPPEIIDLVSPLDGSVITLGNETILSAEIWDPDLVVPGANESLTYEWRSESYGELVNGTGSGRISRTVHLGIGEQNLTLTVTDRMGEASSKVVRVNVTTGSISSLVPNLVLLGPLNGSILGNGNINLSWRIEHTHPGLVDTEVIWGYHPVMMDKKISTNGMTNVTAIFPPDKTYFWSVRSSYLGIEGRCANGPFSFTVKEKFVPSYSIHVTGDTELKMKVGTPFVFKMTLTNKGNNVDVVRTSAILPAGMTVEMADTVQLKPGEKYVLNVTLQASDTLAERDDMATFYFEFRGGTAKHQARVSVQADDKPVQGIESNPALFIIPIVALILIAVVVTTFFLLRKKGRPVPEELPRVEIKPISQEIEEIEKAYLGAQTVESTKFPTPDDEIPSSPPSNSDPPGDLSESSSLSSYPPIG